MHGRIRGLDGLRAIAVGLVLVMHKTDFGAQSRVGFYGVWLFFLLSGYLITGQLYSARKRVEAGQSGLFSELMGFWYRRALRIFPAYYLVLAIISLYYVLSARELHGTLYFVFHLSNVYLSANMDLFHTTWAHFWSLAVEEQFYIFFAPLLLFTRARFALKMCVVVMVASAVRRVVLTSQDLEPFRIYIDSLVNFGLLASGGLLCVVSHRVTLFMKNLRMNRGLPGWMMLFVYLVLAISTTSLLTAEPALLQMSYAVGCGVGLLLLANIISGQSNSLVDALEWPLMSWLGRLSYSIYLVNDYVPADIPRRILTVVAQWAGDGSQPAFESNPYISFVLSAVGLLLCFVIVIAAGYMSWVFVERPALALRDRISSRPKLAWPSMKPAVARNSVVSATSDR